MTTQKQKLENLKKQVSEFDYKTILHIRKTRPTIYCILRHVSASGMSRRISFFMIKNNKPFHLDYLISQVTNYKRDRDHSGLRVGGCGMDMGFAVVYDFSHCIFPTGFKYRKSEHHRNGDISKRDKDGGYALEQRWM